MCEMADWMVGECNYEIKLSFATITEKSSHHFVKRMASILRFPNQVQRGVRSYNVSYDLQF